MRLRFALPVLLVLAVALSGCFQIHALLRLNADGSGTIEETVQFSSFLAMMMESSDSTGVGYIDLDRLAARADSLGEGVRFVRVDSLDDGENVGYRAVYAFDDINTVRYESDQDALGSSEDSGPKQLDLPMRFAYSPGTLTIHMARPPADADARPIHPDSVAARADSIRSQMQGQGATMARAFLDGARMSVAVELPGPITETNASYVDGRTVSLADVEIVSIIDLMIDDPEAAARMQLAETEDDRRASFDRLRQQPGFRVESAETVTVQFDD